MANPYRLFSWELSYFSGKVRAYMRYKDHFDALGPGFEDVLCSFELVLGLLSPNTGSVTVPQVLAPDGTWIHDSSEIIDYLEAKHPAYPVVPDPRTSPRQALAAYLLELLADEWMVVWGFWERWHHSLDGVQPNHLEYNLLQWGSAFAPGENGSGRRAAAQRMFDGPFGVKDARANRRGIFQGLVDLGITDKTAAAWTESNDRLLALLNRHFDEHDFVFGGRPSLADFALMGPLYPHLFRDPVPGFQMRTQYPLVAQWVERTNGTNALDARSYNQKLYSLVDGNLVGRPATSHGGEWLANDEIPETLVPVLNVFFEEMWPVLQSTIERTTAFLESNEHAKGGELPSYTFHASAGFEAFQQPGGALNHEFRIGGVEERRMVVPYHIWMLQRIADVIAVASATTDGRGALLDLIDRANGEPEFLDLESHLASCRVRKEGGRIFSRE